MKMGDRNHDNENNNNRDTFLFWIMFDVNFLI